MRLTRILVFAGVFVLLLVFWKSGPSGLLSTKQDENLVSLLYIRKDNLNGRLQGEIYPVALYSDGKYSDASVDVNAETSQTAGRQTALSRIKDFFVLNDKTKTGKFHVEEISPSRFMCSNMVTGKGRKDGVLLSGIFDSISALRTSSSKGFEDKKEFDYTLKWTLASSRIYKEPATVVVARGDSVRYRTDVMKMAAALLSEYRPDAGTGSEVILETLNFFDLDRDGKAEVSAKLKKQIKKKTKVSQGSGEKEEYNNDIVYLNLWLTYKTGSPQTILSLISHEKEGSWGRGNDIVGTLDINGDGIEEVIMRSSGWEVVDFEIYEYRNNKLEKVFSGAGFGC